MTLSPKWIEQVLRDRGIIGVRSPAIRAYLASVDAGKREGTMAVVRAIQFGTETKDELEGLLKAIGRDSVRDGLTTGKSPAQGPAVGKVPRAEQSVDAALIAFLRRHSGQAFSSKTAMKIELDVLRPDSEDSAVRYTVMVELAPAQEGRSYDWKRKIPFQFTKHELPQLAAVLLGFSTKPLKFGNHGPGADKFFEIEDQGQRMFLKLRKASVLLAMPVEVADVHAWAQICLTALQLNAPELDGCAHLGLLRRIGRMRDSEKKLEA